MDSVERFNNLLLNQSYDGAIGQDAHQEGHAGLTFCGIAALALMGTLETALSERQVCCFKPPAKLLIMISFLLENTNGSLANIASTKWISGAPQ